MKTFWISLKLTIALTLLGAAFYGFWLAEQNGVFRIKDITVSIEKSEHKDVFLESKRQVENDLEQTIGKNTWDVDVSKIAENLKSKDWIQKARVSRRLPASLHVEIIPKKLTFIISQSGRTVLPVAEDSSILPEVLLEKSPDLPLLNGDEFLKEKKFRDSANEIINELPSEGKFSKKTLAEIKMDANKDFWMSLVQGGLRVHLGKEFLPIKVARVNQVLGYLDEHEIQGRVIDADYTQKVLVKMRKQK